jgi:autoinducer 2 (AI-2) kinase
VTEYVLAVDAGSGSCRAALVGAAGGLRALAAREWRHPAEPGVPGGRRFDVQGNWELICACIREAAGGAPVRAVASTGFRGGLVLWDGAGRELWACPNGDARAAAEARELIASGAAAAVQARGGDWVSLTAPARLLWLRRHEPELWARTASVGLVNDWLTRRLTGELVTDPSTGSSSGMFELGARTWSQDTLGECGLDARMVPAVRRAGTRIGTLSAEAAAATGLSPATPVAVGGADTPMGLLGLGVVAPGSCVALGGTHWQQSLVAAEPRRDPAGRLRTLCHALDGQWLVEGIGFLSGLALHWFRDAFGAGATYEALEAEAAAVPPGANGVVALLANLMDARAWAHGPVALAGLDLERSSGRADSVRAILEAAAFVARGHVQALEAIAGGRFERVLMAGGATRGALWPQIVADVLGREVAVSRRAEASVHGAALAAGVAAGWHPDLRAAAAAVDPDVGRTLAPDPAAAAAYDALYPRWRRVYEAALPAAGEGRLAPLWRAPGV